MLHLSLWMEALRPVRTKLLPQLSAAYRDAGRRETERFDQADVHARSERLAGALRTVISHSPPFVCRAMGELLYRYAA